MLYVPGAIIALLAAAWFLRGSVSLRKKDEFAVKHSVDAAIAHQTMATMHHNQHQGPMM